MVLVVKPIFYKDIPKNLQTQKIAKIAHIFYVNKIDF